MARSDDPQVSHAVVYRIFLFECNRDPGSTIGSATLAAAQALLLCVRVFSHGALNETTRGFTSSTSFERGDLWPLSRAVGIRFEVVEKSETSASRTTLRR
jgi:hypothetical protein